MNEHRKLEIQRLIDGLQDSELRLLYSQLGERYRLIQRAQEMQALRDFRLMDRVYFHHGGEHITGTVVRINQRTVSVLTDIGRRWTVAPDFLRQEEDSPTSDDISSSFHGANTAPSHSPPVSKKSGVKSKRKKHKKRH